MNSQDIQNLQESYLAVYDDETRENLEFENWVNNLLDEGYDLSSYTWDEMAKIYIDEARAEGVKEYQPRKRNPLPKEKPLSGEKGDGSGYGADKKFTQDTDAKSFKPGVDVPKVKQFGRISRIIPHGIGDHANKTQSRVSTIVRKDPGAPTSQKLPPQEKKKNLEIVRKTKNEEFQNWVNNLLDEGYDLSGYTWDELYEGYNQVHQVDEELTGSRKKRASEILNNKLRDVETLRRLAGRKRTQKTDYGSGNKAARRAGKEVEDSRVAQFDESYDYYDIILSYLLDEGYADTIENAESIMVNMSEDWRESIFEEKKPLPVSRMAKQARRIAFSHGTDVNSDEGSSGNVPHSNPTKALAKMARIGGKKVKQHIKKGYEQGSQYDPYYQELNWRNPSRNKYS